ncbi:MAG: hypothetical protein QOG44_1737 [Acidimicrobiaceae bacterium]|nr:hypothetical protein [Acidimicrobiaceae bacterium]
MIVTELTLASRVVVAPTASVRRPAPEPAGQVCANLLFAAAMSCHAPLALIAVAEADGRWTMLRYGIASGDIPADNVLFGAVGAVGAVGTVGAESLEIGDLRRHPQLGETRTARSPLGIRFVYGLPLRSESGLLGVLCLFDRCTRQLTTRERRSMAVIADKIAERLATGRRTNRWHPQVAPDGADDADGADVADRSAASRRTICRRPPLASEPAQLADGPGASRRTIEPRPMVESDLVNIQATRHPVGAPDVPKVQGIAPVLLHTKEVAALFDVTERSVSNWANSNRLPSFRTAGGHLRFRREDVLALQARRW